jgi:hypothetical protein
LTASKHGIGQNQVVSSDFAFKLIKGNSMQFAFTSDKTYFLFVLISFAALGLSPLVYGEVKAKAVAPIEVMIVGTYHMGNRGRNVYDPKVESGLTPEKQKQIADVTNRLAKFKPNKIAVERIADQPDMTTSKFDNFTLASLFTDDTETTQIGYRLAQQLGHKAVYAIDEQSETIDYFPYQEMEAFAKANNQDTLMEPSRAWGKRETAEFEIAQKTQTVRQLLAEKNKPERANSEMQLVYYPWLAIGDQKSQAGAELNAGWYQRNAKIFAKLNLIAKPGDKILVLYGAGHNFWLRHFVSLMPGYKLVEANAYLK